MTISELNDRLMRYGILTNDATDAVIENAKDYEDLRELLFNQDAWYDIYGPGRAGFEYLYLEEHIFETDEYRNSPLPKLERMIWQDALIRNGCGDWIHALRP